MEEQLSTIPHDADYVARLGMAVYAFAYTEWLIIYLVTWLEPSRSVRELGQEWSRQIGRALQEALAKADLPASLRDLNLGDRWLEVLESRNDIIHAHPATDKLAGQRLHRTAPGRVHWVSSARLTAFVRDVEQINRDANAIRRHLSG